MKLGRWHIGEQPKKSGWYLRDYRNLNNKMNEGIIRTFSVDYFMLDKSELIGFWYIDGFDGLEEAAWSNLPWCKIKE